MRKSLGGLLCLALGAFLIVTGATGTSPSAVGGTNLPTCNVAVGVSIPCPTGTITITEITKGPRTPPATWPVTITSTNCTDPSGNTIDAKLDVPNDGSVTSASYFVYTSPDQTTKCSYELTDPVPGFTSTFNPTPPVGLPFNGGQTGNNTTVTLTSVSVAATTSAAPTSVAPTTSAAASSSAASSVTAASSSAALAATGTRTSVGPSLFAGTALCVLGLVLLLAAVPRRRIGLHRD